MRTGDQERSPQKTPKPLLTIEQKEASLCAKACERFAEKSNLGKIGTQWVPCAASPLIWETPLPGLPDSPAQPSGPASTGLTPEGHPQSGTRPPGWPATVSMARCHPPAQPAQIGRAWESSGMWWASQWRGKVIGKQRSGGGEGGGRRKQPGSQQPPPRDSSQPSTQSRPPEVRGWPVWSPQLTPCPLMPPMGSGVCRSGIECCPSPAVGADKASPVPGTRIWASEQP